MAELSTSTLPVLSLTTGVVLPGMVVTIPLETPDAVAAADAATDGRLLLVPKVDGRYSSVGVVAQVEDRGELRGGLSALVIRGLHRAIIGAGVTGTGEPAGVKGSRNIS